LKITGFNTYIGYNVTF